MYDNSAPDYLYLTVLGGAMSYNPSNAGLCNECGKCIKLCPQKIDIPQYLKEVACDMEGNDLQDKIKAVTLKLDKRKRFLQE